MLLPARVVSAGQRRPRISLGPRSFSPSLGLAISGKGLTSDQHLAANVQRQGNPHPRDSVFVLPSAAPQAGLTGLVHLPPSVDPAIPQKKAEALKFYCTKSMLADWTVGPRAQMGRGNWPDGRFRNGEPNGETERNVRFFSRRSEVEAKRRFDRRGNSTSTMEWI